LKYPVDRTALYWIPLWTLLALTLVALANRGPAKTVPAGSRIARRLVSVSLATCLGVAVAQYVLQFDTRYYAQWRYDAGTKQMMRIMVARAGSHPARRVRVGASWMLEPSLNFYRQRYRLTWMDKVTRDGPRGDFDYYLLIGEDTALVSEKGLAALYRHPLSGAVLAVRQSMLQSRQ
ncbi:MAG: hypothetical protein ACPL88_13470, partial [Bryobacteraceae bacterium]